MKINPTLALTVLAGLSSYAGTGARAGVLDDGQILGIYIQVNSFDIETALLARTQAASSDLRKLAGQVASDHISVRDRAYVLAQECGVIPSLPADRLSAAIKHSDALKGLVALKGTAFDRAYLEHETAFHAGAIDAAKQLLEPSATCPELRAHFKEVLPAFESHLSHTKAARTSSGQ